jgi:hypothetical protein
MGEMRTFKIMRQLLKEWNLSDKMTVSWDINNSQEIAHAEKKFIQYLSDGWMAFCDESRGRRQIFKFNPKCNRIVLIPPLGGG